MKWKNKGKYKSPWEIEKGDFSRIFIFILASNNTSNKINIIKTKTKTLLILMKSSYPTYHNNKIKEQNKTTLFTYHTLWLKNTTHSHMCIWIFFHLHYSSLQLKPQLLVVIWQHQHYHYWQPLRVLRYYPDANIRIKENTLSDMIINITLRNITL